MREDATVRLLMALVVLMARNAINARSLGVGVNVDLK
jgi:hypothetical protein